MKSKQVNPRVQMYVRAGVLEDLQELSDRTGLSISVIAWLAFSNGYPKVRDDLLKKLQLGKKINVQTIPQKPK